MKIAILSDGIWPLVIGGMQKHTYLLACNLAKHNIEVDIYCKKEESSSNLTPQFCISATKNITIIYIEIIPYTFVGAYLYNEYVFSKKILALISSLQTSYNFIYAQGFTALAFVGKSKFFNNLGVNLHGLEPFQITHGLKNSVSAFVFRTVQKFIIKRTKFNFSLGGKLTGYLCKYSNKVNIIEIPNGISARWLNAGTISNSINKKHFLFIGRYETRKGIDNLHNALKLLIDSKVEFSISFIGPIPLHKQIIHPSITYLGKLINENEIKEVVSQHQVLVCPSYSEGMPTVILEAMSQKLAIIANNVGACSLLVDDTNGWLMEGNSSQLIYDTMLSALKNTGLNEKQNKSYEKAKNYDWSIIAQKHIEFFQTLRSGK